MNAAKVQAEISKIVEQYRERNPKFARKQYAAAKWQMVQAQELSILEMIPNAPYSQKPGFVEMNEIFKAVEDSGSARMNKFGEGEAIGASALYRALNEADPMDEEFEAPLLDFAAIS